MLTHLRDSAATAHPATWRCRLGGREYELSVTPGFRARVVLRVDGEQVHDRTEWGTTRRVDLGPGRRVMVRLTRRGRLRRAWVRDGRGRELDFDAPPGSRAAALQAWGRAHPWPYALRIVAIRVGGLLTRVFGLGALFLAFIAPVLLWATRFLPSFEVPLPQVDLSEIRLPDIDWSVVHLPDVTLPPWLAALVDWYMRYQDIIQTLIVGAALAVWEHRRIVRQERLRAAERLAWPDHGERIRPAPASPSAAGQAKASPGPHGRTEPTDRSDRNRSAHDLTGSTPDQ